MKRYLSVLALALAALAFPQPTVAENTILFVTPSRVIIGSSEDIAVVNVSNQSTEERRYDITMIDQVMKDDGMTQKSDNFEYSAARMLRFVPKRFSLKPGERQTVRVMARRPAGLADGDYHSHMLFREIPVNVKTKEELEAERAAAQAGKSTFEIRAIYGIGVPVIVQSGTITSDLHLGNVNYVPASEGVPAHLTLELNRTGNAEAGARLSAQFVPASGDPITIVKGLWVPVYREVDKVTKRIPLDSMPADSRGGKITLQLTKHEDAETPEVETKEISF